ncbi:longevity assurance proteins LAG1/LAC1 [Phanerochaete sordida]|uniref:Longevity assurance proteins LAG1/LAC1 n=1 Tax=Phanerochaete sordida TaxID=48140 RepID=A0A9P3L811_9APHY|nr:longevity assurance proteins LAG1/LAC1 [Phanerochaete sordida]
MAPSDAQKRRKRAGTLDRIEADPNHHLTGGFRPQTPLNVRAAMPTPVARHGSNSPWSTKSAGFWADLKSLRWVVVPESSLKLLLIGVVLWANWQLLAPYVAKGVANPFEPLLFISHRVPGSTEEDPRYQKGWFDLVFIAYNIIFWSFVRQSFLIYVCKPTARYFGIRKEAKIDRFGEQAYATAYFLVMGSWGLRVMSQLPTWWYRTEHFWIDYPHWDMQPELKRYYLMQAAYWCHQFLVLVLKLEKPRKDYQELVAHHFVTLWLIGWSYLINLTRIGNAVYVSMDVPDTFLGLSKVLNYIQYDKTKIAVFTVLLATWSYFRHYLNIVMLWSVWTQFDLMPETSKRWEPKDGVWLVWWMKYQIFAPIFLLQLLNLFWYFLILRIAYRALHQGSKTTDDRSDDEGDDEPANEKDD